MEPRDPPQRTVRGQPGQPVALRLLGRTGESQLQRGRIQAQAHRLAPRRLSCRQRRQSRVPGRRRHNIRVHAGLQGPPAGQPAARNRRLADGRPGLHDNAGRRRQHLAGDQRLGDNREHRRPVGSRGLPAAPLRQIRGLLRPQQRTHLRPQRRQPRQALDSLVRRQPLLYRHERQRTAVHKQEEPPLLPHRTAQHDEARQLRPGRKALCKRDPRSLRMPQPRRGRTGPALHTLPEGEGLRHPAHTVHRRRGALGLVFGQRVHPPRKHLP